MQYTHKIARRLAASRGAALAVALVIASACQSDDPSALGPGDSPSGWSPITRVVIDQLLSEIETDQKITLVAQGRSPTGESAPVEVEWTASGGNIDSTGTFFASAPGRYTVYAEWQQDYRDSTKLRVVRPRIVSLAVSPGNAVLAPLRKQVFTATGRLRDSSTVSLSVKWAATGGTIDSAGVYNAPKASGSYRVIASRKGVSDTATVTVASTDSAASIERIVLSPASLSLVAGATQAFTTSALMSDNTTAPVAVTYRATGGTITAEGLYTAGQTPGTYRVIAAAPGGLADTSAVTITAAPVTVEQVTLTPATASLRFGDTQQFSASARMSDGSTAQAPVTYDVTGGTITGAGLYTAGRVEGGYQVVATAANGKADTSVVAIAASDVTLRDLILSPASVTLQAGATQQFSTTGKMSDGSTSAVPVTYTATGGAITANGLFTAGRTAGAYRVIAAHQGGSLADTAAVTITASPTPPPPPPPSGTGELADQADSLVNTLSVQTHLSYSNVYSSGWSSIIRPRLLELGVRHIRERMNGASSTVIGRFQDLAANGVRLTAGCWPEGGNYGDASHCVAKANAIGPAVIDALDGWNEVDGGKAGPGWGSAWVTWEAALWQAYKGNATWRDRPLYANSLAHASSADEVGYRASILDYGNMHSYPAAGLPSNVSQSWIPQWQKISGSKPLVVTETGYHTCPSCTNGNGVSMLAQSKYLSRLPFEYFNRGIRRANIYELIDQGVSTTDREKNWGLVKNDGSVKPAYTTLKNIITLLEDPGAGFTPGRLSYSLNGALATTHTTLLQKRSGKFYLVLWQEVKSWDIPSKSDVRPPDDAVTLTLGTPASAIKVYRPSVGTGAIQSGSGTSINLAVPDEVIVVEVTP